MVGQSFEMSVNFIARVADAERRHGGRWHQPRS